MPCHSHCAACCIAPTISTPLPNMPNGKPPGVPCVNLDESLRCTVYEERPAVCREFVFQDYSCGQEHAEALQLIGQLESDTCCKEADTDE